MNPKKILPWGFLIYCLTMQISSDVRATDMADNLIVASDTWRKERISFPLPFAPALTYKGFEDIRFAPGWANEEAEDFWTYTFVWYLDENPQLSTGKLQKSFNTYFDGLMRSVAQGKKLDETEVTPTHSIFIAHNKQPNFTGKIELFDAFFTKAAISLNVEVWPKICNNLEKHVVLFRLSPLKTQHAIWKEMNRMELAVNCE